jgi:antitoxin component YwqK of YwqJK toxin-antitoxin module
MTIEEVKVELSLLTVRRERLEGEILAILNKGCLPLDEARKKMKAEGIKTEIWEDGEYVVFTTPEGKKGYAPFPPWYPMYISIDDVFAVLKEERPLMKTMRDVMSQNMQHIDYEKAVKKIEEYLDNQTKLEELSKALGTSGQFLGYTKYLIESGYLYPDGKRVIKSLDDVAAALKDYLNKNPPLAEADISPKEINLTWQFLQETFLQPDGKNYSEKSCKDAIRMANY